jgi:putative transposase
MTRLYGWAPRGRRLVAKIPHGHWKTATFLAALRNDRVDARPACSTAPSMASAFSPTSNSSWSRPSGATTSSCSTISDRTKARPYETPKAAGARLLFLPKYSPDLNPIEQLFAKLKGYVRKAEPRTLDAVSDAIAQALTAIRPEECANSLTSAGYASA